MGNKSSKKGGPEKEPAAPPAAEEQKQAEEGRDNVSSLPTLDVPAQHRRRNRRCSVSAEVDHDPNEKFEPRVVEKSEEARARILAAVRKSFLFAALDRDQLRTVVDAMDEKAVVPGDVLIHQGAPGDFFYIIDHGQYEVWKRLPGEDPKKVFAYDNEGSFGELALMYNAPRAATVKAASDGVVWAVDRATFRHIIVTAGAEQRRKYEEFIQRVPLFSKLTAEERTRIADCLVPESYEDGETVLKLGDPGDKFYIIESGKAVATQFAAGDREVVVGRMEEGMFFGERALITDEPRAANVKADGYLKLAAMDRAAFERLLGDCRDIMGRHIQKYQSAEQLVEAGTAEEASAAPAAAAAAAAEEPAAEEEPKEEAAAEEAAAVEEPKEESEEAAAAEEPAVEEPKEEAVAEEPAAEEPKEEAAAEEPAAEEPAVEEPKEEPKEEAVSAEEPKEEAAAAEEPKEEPKEEAAE